MRKFTLILTVCTSILIASKTIASQNEYENSPGAKPAPNVAYSDYNPEVMKLKYEVEAFNLLAKIKNCVFNHTRVLDEEKLTSYRRLGILVARRSSLEEEAEFATRRKQIPESCKALVSEELRLLQSKLEQAEYAELERLKQERATFNHPKRVTDCYNRLEAALCLSPNGCSGSLKYQDKWKQLSMLQCQSIEDMRLKDLKDKLAFAESVIKNRKNYYQEQMLNVQSLMATKSID